MGCISERGCLGPKRRQKQIYFEIVQAIHVQALDKQQQKIPSSPNHNNLYNEIRKRVQKKGYLRKLLDNLLSHKDKINDSLVLNLKLTSQSSTIQSKYAGLLISNQIITQIYKIKKRNPTIQQQKSYKSGSSADKLLRQDNQSISIDIRYDLGFFRIILHVLENQNKIYSDVLLSIDQFCQERKEKISCKNEIWKILDILHVKLSKNILVSQTTRSYYLLLRLIKDGNAEETSIQKYLYIFIQLLLKESQKQAEDAEQLQRKQKYFKIVKLYIQKCMNTWDSTIIYRSLLKIYQEKKYHRAHVAYIQQKIISIITSSDLNAHILRGLFLYFLQYLSTTEKTMQKTSIQSQFKLQRYPKIYEKQSKLRSFEALRRWSEKRYINMNESLNFSGSTLVTAYVLNMQGQKQFIQSVIHQFFTLTEIFSHESNLIIINLLLCQINSDKSNDNLRKILINLTREILQARKMLQYKLPEQFSYFLPLNIKFNLQTRIELIQLSGFIIKNIQARHLIVSQYESNHISINICEFLHSLYYIYHCQQVLQKNTKKQEQDMILYRYQFSNSIISFLKCFIQKNAFPYIICFLQALNNNLSKKITNKIQIYFQIYIIYEAMHQINAKIKIPDRMMSINFKIGPSSKNSQFKAQIEAFVDQLLGISQEKLINLQENQKKELVQLRKFTMVKTQFYDSIQKSLSAYFKPSRQMEISHSSQQQKAGRYRFNQYNRQSQNNSFSSNNRTKIQQDLSFKDIFQRIGQN